MPPGRTTNRSGAGDGAARSAQPDSPKATPAAVIGALTLMSRLLGFARDVTLAPLFFGRALDVFALAFTVPNLFRRLFGEGALASALVPVFVEHAESGDPKRAARAATRAFWLVLLGLGAVALVISLVSLAPALWARPVSAGKVALFSGLLAIMVPYAALICGSAVLGAFLNANRRFAAAAAAPLLLNLALIAGALLTRSVWGLAAAVIAGGVLQLAIQLPQALGLGVSMRPELAPSDPDVRRAGAALVPAVAGVVVFQVNVLLDRVIAEVMIPGDGAVGALFLGNRLMQLPLAVFAIAAATAAFPELAASWARKDPDGFRGRLRDSAVSVLFWTAPAAVGLACLSEPVVELLFGYGRLRESAGHVPRTGLVVLMYAPGIISYGLAGLYAKALYARREAKAVVAASAASAGSNLALNVALVLLFQRVPLTAWRTVVPCGEAGLALASSASGVVYLAMLAKALAGGERTVRRGLALAAGSLLAGVAAGAATWLALASEPGRAAWDWLWQVPTTAAPVLVGAAVAVLLAARAADGAILLPYLRIALTALGMGVWVNLLVSSLPPVGDSWMIPVERVLAPVVLGAGGYWFLAGFTAAPEYERARENLGEALRAVLPSLRRKPPAEGGGER